MKVPFVDLYDQHKKIKEEIFSEIEKIFKDSSFVLGEQTNSFEENFASFCEADHCTGVSNGTQALELTLRALKIEKGDEVILPANTFVATAEAVANVGATPVLVDVRKDTLLLDPDQLESALSDSSKVIIGVHLFGQPCDVKAINDIARQEDIYFIEDAAQAHGARFKSKKVGALGTAGCFSFYPSKNLGSLGEGGAVVTNSEEINEAVELLRNHGEKKKYDHVIIGTNSRLPNLQAAALDVKLDYLEKWNQKRRERAEYYNRLFFKIDEVRPIKQKEDRESVFHLYVVRVQERGKLKDYLEKQDIGVGIHYPTPIHLTEAFEDLEYKKGSFPNTEEASEEILSLPMFPGLTQEQIDYVVDNIKNFYEKN